MKMPNITGLMKVGKTFIQANRPEILFGASVVTTVAAVGLAAKGGYEARGKVDKLEIERVMAGNETPLTSKEKIQLTWLCYMPALTTTVAAVGSTTGLHLVHVKDKKMLAQAGLAALEEVKASAKQYEQDVKDAIAENTTPKKAEAIETAIDEKGQERVQNTDGVVEELYLVRDGRSGRDIWSNQTRIDEAVNQVNKVLAQQGDCELNTFYGAAGFELLFPEGDDWGWSGDFVSLQWKTETKDDGRPVRRFDFRKPPTPGFSGA